MWFENKVKNNMQAVKSRHNLFVVMTLTVWGDTLDNVFALYVHVYVCMVERETSSKCIHTI